MKTKLEPLLLSALVSAIAPQPSVFAQGTAFTYQGRLNDGLSPVSGSYDFRFRLAVDALANAYFGSPVLTNGVPLVNGMFIVTIDFGSGAFAGADRWLEVSVKTNGGAAYSVMTPLQEVKPVPYAVFAGSASSLNGTVALEQLPASVVTNNATGLCLSGAFNGDGANLTNVNAASLGALPASGFWKTGGNAGATGSTPFLGTIDAQPLEFKVNTIRALRLEPNPDCPNVIGGFPGNLVTNGCIGAFIGGGGMVDRTGNYVNRVGHNFAAVLGGIGNTAAGYVSTAMGCGATASGLYSTAMGHKTAASRLYSTAMGNGTRANGESSTTMGYQTTATGFASTALGSSTSADGTCSIAMGGRTIATGDYSAALGSYAQATHRGSFVWSSYDNPAPSFEPNRFHVLAPNGLSVDFGDQRSDGGGSNWVVIGPSSFAPGNTIYAANGARLTDGGIWQNASDRSRKTDFAEVAPREILEKVAMLPVRTWRYTNETETVRHLGPVAQDFNAAFGLGTDEKSIATVDADGVALAAIQGLNQKLTRELNRRDAENAELKARLAALERLVASLTPKGN